MSMEASISTSSGSAATRPILLAGGEGVVTASLAAHLAQPGKGAVQHAPAADCSLPDRWRQMSEAGLRQALAEASGTSQRLDGLVCVAADITSATHSTGEATSWWAVFRDAVIATDTLLRLATEFVSPDSRIVIVLSRGALDPHAEAAPRAAAMAAGRNLMQSWALTLAPRNVNVNAICIDLDGSGTTTDPGGCPVLEAVEFLLSDAARDVTGQTLVPRAPP